MIKFPSVNPKQDHKIAIVILDTTDQYKNNWTKELVKNSIDFEIATASWLGFDIFVTYDENQSLSVVSRDYDFALVVSSGFMIGHNDQFYQCLKNFCAEKDFLVAGHILDNKDAYYELHHQCYVIDLNKYKILDCPEIGDQSFHEHHQQTCPIRSVENFHDDYTPLWIKSGSESKTYHHKCHGWNIISKGLEAGYEILSFDDTLRNLKTYFYPDDREVLNRLYLEHNVAASSWVNVFGTSDYSVLGEPIDGNLRYLITPCLGIDFVHFLANHGFDENTVVRFVDYNFLSLEFMSQLVCWDGNDYIKFLESFGTEKTNFLNIPQDSWYGKTDTEKKWQELKLKYDWPNLWNDIKNKVKFEFRFTDFLHLGNDSWLGIELNNPNTIINFSNVFNYYSTSIFHTLEYKVTMENRLIENIQEVAPHAYLIFDHRSWRGFKPYTKFSKRAQAQYIEKVNMNQLTKPSWHYGQDWK